MTAGGTLQLRTAPAFHHMLSITADFESLTNEIIACAIGVQKALGPGLLESVYQECLEVELKTANLEG